MTEVPFHATRTGRVFYEVTMPKLVEELARLNATLVELIEVVERRDNPRAHRPDPEPPTDHGSHGATPLNPNP